MYFSVVLLTLAVTCSCSRLSERQIRLYENAAVPLVDPPSEIAGYFKLNRTYDAQMFYFFYESRSDPANDPVILWMTGGPGCASEIAIFYENGPYYIQDDLTLADNKFSWNAAHNMIYVDQPIWTGFSYSDNIEDEEYNESQVAQDVYEFLQEFFQAHPKFIENDFFVIGESYGGHYVPAVSNRIFQANKVKEGPIILNFKGLAIGDGWTDPATQEGAYADYLYMNNIITNEEKDYVNGFLPACQQKIEKCNNGGSRFECIEASDYCGFKIFETLLEMTDNINYYDITKKCTYGYLCYDFSLVERYLAQQYVREELGVGDRDWSICSNRVYRDFEGDWAKSLAYVFPEMLDAGIRVNLYEGVNDWICNWLGNRRWADNLQWSQSQKWASVQDIDWTLPNNFTTAGTVAQVGPMQFTKVNGAGHMVPMDQPEIAQYMIYAFTRNLPLIPPTVNSAIAEE